MSNPTVTPFSFQTSTIRTVTLDGEHWFVAKDVAEALGYKDPSMATRSHCRGVSKLHPILDSLGRTQEVRIIREPDLYRLIVGSTLPAAQAFEAWVFEEVLPTLHKTGRYTSKDARHDLEIVEATNRQLQLRISELENQLIQQSIEVDELKRQNAELQGRGDSCRGASRSAPTIPPKPAPPAKQNKRLGPEWHTMQEIALAWDMSRRSAALRVTDLTRRGEVEVMPSKTPWQPYYYRFKNMPVPPATPPTVSPKRSSYFQGFMEDGKLSLKEYDPAYDFKEIPRWLLEDAFFTDGSRERRDNKELLLEIAHIATMRAEYGAKEARRRLDGAPAPL